MTECVSQDVHRRPLASELCGVAVPETVGVYPPLNASLRGQAAEKVAHVGCARTSPSRVQNSRQRPLILSGCRRSSQRASNACVPSSNPTVRERSPFPWRTLSVPPARSASLGSRARASRTRRPHRHRTAISARLRIRSVPGLNTRRAAPHFIARQHFWWPLARPSGYCHSLHPSFAWIVTVPLKRAHIAPVWGGFSQNVTQSPPMAE